MSFAMSGIFFDESPHQYSAEAVEFMRKATQHVKDTSGLQGQKTVSNGWMHIAVPSVQTFSSWTQQGR